jgi:uncharacterized membrane protein YhaH (DUF805 family)
MVLLPLLFLLEQTQVTDVYGIKTDNQFKNTLEDNLTYRGAPHKLISDSAQIIIGNKVQDILRTLCIPSCQSEPYQQQQSPAAQRYQTIKRAVNRILDRTGAPDYTWWLCLEYVCFLLNHTYNDNIQGIPLQHLTGHTPDISVFYASIFGRTSTTRKLIVISLLTLLKLLATLLVSLIIVVMPLRVRSLTHPLRSLFIVPSFVLLTRRILTFVLSHLVGRVKLSPLLSIILVVMTCS